MASYDITFDGSVLERGFWLYLIQVKTSEGDHFYVGLTGDSSSCNASSPFARIGQHLDFRPNARGNSLARNLSSAGVTPSKSQFRMVAVGPLYPEQAQFSAHKPPRDALAALERDLAAELKARGHSVLGSHSSRKAPQPELLAQVLAELESRIPELRAV